MDRLFFDTNILMDVGQARSPHYEDSLAILDLCRTKHARGACSALSFSNMAYVYRSGRGEDLRSFFRYLRSFLDISPMGSEEVNQMLRDNFSDLEDSLQWHSATAWEATHLVSRNTQDFPQHQKLRVIHPRAYVSQRMK